MVTDRIKRNVLDVDYATADGNRPMREVLRERDAFRKRIPKPRREFAFRVRAGMQGILAACECAWPLARAATESEHETWCPGHQCFVSGKAAAATPAYPDRLPDTPDTHDEIARALKGASTNTEPTSDTKGT